MLWLYVSITNGRGVVPVRIDLVDADEEREPILSEVQDVPFSDPRAVVEMCIAMQNLTFPEPGEYRFQMYASGEFIMERRIIVNQLEEPDDNE